MKMEEYQDYVRVLYDKYLAKLFYLLIIILAGAVVIDYFVVGSLQGGTKDVLAGLIIIIILFYGTRFLLIYVPHNIYRLTHKLINTAKKDIQDIRDKHNTNENN